MAWSHRQGHKNARRSRQVRLRPHLLIEKFETRDLLANDVRLVTDINPGRDLTVAPIEGFTQVGSWVYFSAETAAYGKELWRTDGTAAGTQLVKDIVPGQPSSYPRNLTNVNGTLYFTANDGTTGFELWRSDGTDAGTFLVNELRVGTSSSSPSKLVALGSALFFAASTFTSSGSYLIRDIGQPFEKWSDASLNNALVINGQMFLSTATVSSSAVSNSSIHVSNGTLAGTTLVQNIPGALSEFITVNGKLYFQNRLNNNAGYELWVSDGTSAGTKASMPLSGPVKFRSYQGLLYFSNTDSTNGAELWRTDGTLAGTSLVKDIVPGSDSSSPQFVGEYGNEMFLRVSKPGGGRALWKSNGTSEGTVLVKDVDGFGVTDLGSTALLIGNEPNLNAELWRTDGTSGGTTLVKEFVPGASAGMNSLYPALGKALLTVNSAGTSPTSPASQLWISDGTEAGTILLNDFERPASSNPSSLMNVNGLLYFTANDGSSGKELWRSDGTAGGTFKIDIRPGSGSSYPHAFTEWNGKLYFFANDGTHGFELWRSDGTITGTQLVKDINPNNSLSAYNAAALGQIITFNGLLHFTAADGATGAELWRSDGTAAGTTLAVDIFPGSQSSNPTKFITVGSKLFFRARGTAFHGYELWKSDGTAAGTSMVIDMAANSGSTFIGAMLEYQGKLLFQVGTDLLVTDGTSAGTTGFFQFFSGQMTNINGTLYFGRSTALNGTELWKIAGSPPSMTMVKDIAPFDQSSSPFQLTNVNGQLYFFTDGIALTRGLWTSDGTTDGTRMVQPVSTNTSFHFSNAQIANFAGSIYFTADQTALWFTDGTTEGTQRVIDPSGRSAPAVTSNLVEVGGTIYFGGLDNNVGSELFALVASDFGDAPNGSRLIDDGARHLGFGPLLGSRRDTGEADGVPSATANSDDLSGVDDEDGWLSALTLSAGSSFALQTKVTNASPQTRLYAWVDWNQDGDWQDAGESVIAGEAVVSGVNDKTILVPSTAKAGTAYARLRIANQVGLSPLGPAADGEVEDYAVQVNAQVVLDLSSATSSNLTIQRSGSDLKVIDNITQSNLIVSPINNTSSLVIRGATNGPDTILVDYASGGFFTLTNGIDLQAAGGNDTVTIKGLGNTLGNYSQQSQVRRFDSLDGALTSPVSMLDFETLAFQALQKFNFISDFDIGTIDFSVDSTTPLVLPARTTISGGKLTARDITLSAGEVLSGHGTINGRFNTDVNSQLTLGGQLTVGDSTSTSGFSSQGKIDIGSHKLILLDADQATLGQLTQLGLATQPGTLSASRGIVVPFTSLVVGYGTIDSPNLPEHPLHNQGELRGQSSERPLTATGYVTGDGTLDGVQVSGTYSPSAGTAITNNVSVQYAGTLIADLGGPTPGTQHDQYRHTTTAMLGGQLVVRLANGYVPNSDALHELLVASVGITGTFSSLIAPQPPAGKNWQLIYSANSVQLALRELSLTLDVAEISELGGVAQGTLRRSAWDSQSALVVNLTSSDATEAVVPATVTFEAGKTEAKFDITAVDDALLDGPQSVTIIASAVNYQSRVSQITVTDVETLTLSLEANAASENSQTITGTVTRSNTDIGSSLTVTLTSSDVSEATVPATVVIAAGQSSATFAIMTVDDDLLDGPQTVQISAIAAGYFRDAKNVTVTDAEGLELTLDLSSISERNGSAQGTVRRSNSDTQQSLFVNLTTSDSSEVSLPNLVTIPAGASSVSFIIRSVDDTLLDGSQDVQITASSVGYTPSTAVIEVTDYETVLVTVAPNQMSEKSGSLLGRVKRSNTNVSSALIVLLRSSDTSEATVPAAVTIPIGQFETTFTITAVDDGLLDGRQLVDIAASATGYVGSTANIEVEDFETLTVTIDQGAINEVGGVATGTVTRDNTDRSQPLLVNLTSNLTTEATVPSTITIPANAASATFTINAVDDGVLDGTKSVQITSAAAGYVSGTASINVTDSVVLTISLPTNQTAEAGGNIVASVTRSNSNVSQPLSVLLTSSDISEAVVPASITIAAGQQTATFQISAVDDNLLDGSQAVTIIARSAGYQDGNAIITVTDFETLQVSTRDIAISENGGVTTGTVSLSNTDRSQPLTVQLTVSDSSELSVPSVVTIPAGQSLINFAISAVDDTLLDGTQSVTIRASAVGYVDGERIISVDDSETLSITATASSISESGGSAVGTVTRSNTDLTLPLTVSLFNSDITEATVPSSVVIPAGQASVSFVISAVDDTSLDGSQLVIITAKATGYAEGTFQLTVTDAESLSLSIHPTPPTEQGGGTVGTVSRGNSDISQELVVFLTSSDTSEATVPETIRIPAGERSAEFFIAAVDDDLLDGTQRVTISVSHPAYMGASQIIEVTDAEYLYIEASPNVISERGGVTTATVTRGNTNVELPLEVTVGVNASFAVSIPKTVVIPAGQKSTNFLVRAVDDDFLFALPPLRLQVTADGYQFGAGFFTITDYETLSLSLESTDVSEAAGQVSARVTRNNSDIAEPITVSVSSSDTGVARVPGTVVIPAAQKSASFLVDVVDNNELDGNRVARITINSNGYIGTEAELSVGDYELLTLSFASSQISEKGGRATATVSRGVTALNQALTVQLSSSPFDEAMVPASVIIPAGQKSVSFTIDAVDDDLLDGPQVVSITAAATGFLSSVVPLTVTDAESISLSPVSPVSENGQFGNLVVSISDTNLLSDRVIFLTSSSPGVISVVSSIVIPAGFSRASVGFTIVDDDLLDGTQQAIITATAPGYDSGTTSVTVLDYEELSLVIDRAIMWEKDGTAIGTVTRGNTDRSLPLVIQLTSEDTSEVSVPSQVTIPAGQSSVNFAIEAVDDEILDGPQDVRVIAQATGYVQAAAQIGVIDFEQLAFEFVLPLVSERDGSIEGRVIRTNTDKSQPLTVTLTSRDPRQVSVPTSVVIPAGISSASFTLSAFDNTLLDGDRITEILAQSVGYIEARQTITVSDYETLTLALGSETIVENRGHTIATVTRGNSDISLPQDVQLSFDPLLVTMPANVQIPAGQSSITFEITAVDDLVLDGIQTAVIGVAAAGYRPDQKLLTITDNDRAFPWQNPRNPLDVNDDGFVTAIDALLVVNALNTNFQLPTQLPDPFIPVQYLDVNGNGSVTPIDALLVINELNRPRSGEGEWDEVIDLLSHLPRRSWGRSELALAQLREGALRDACYGQ